MDSAAAAAAAARRAADSQEALVGSWPEEEMAPGRRDVGDEAVRLDPRPRSSASPSDEGLERGALGRTRGEVMDIESEEEGSIRHGAGSPSSASAWADGARHRSSGDVDVCMDTAAPSGVPERNVRRRTMVSWRVEPSMRQNAPASDGADAGGRRVRHRSASDRHEQVERREMWWIREAAWMPDWMPRLPPLPGERHDEHGRDHQSVADQRELPTVVTPADEAPPAVGPSQTGHVLRITGNLVWCMRCAAYAARRWGVRLRGACQPGTGDSTRSRLELLMQSRHPITGLQLL